MKRENLLIACVLLAAVVLAGCGPLAPVGRNVAGTAATTPVTATPVTLHMSVLQEPSTLDPGLVQVGANKPMVIDGGNQPVTRLENHRSV